MPYSNSLFNVTSDLGSGYDRLRVDVGQTGFFEGREFRSFYEFSADTSNAIAVGASVHIRFSCAVDFVLQKLALNVDKGGIRAQNIIAPTPSGSWTDLTVLGKNRSVARRSPFYTTQASFSFGGSFTGGTLADVLRARSASQTVSATNAGSNMDTERLLPAGSYYILLKPLTGVNDPSEGLLTIDWEERPVNYWGPTE